MLSRRAFLKGAALVSGGTLAAGAVAAVRDDTGNIVLEQHTVGLPDLPSEFESYRIGLLSDLHLGYCVLDEWIERSFKLVQESRVDLLLLAGDYIWIPDGLKNERLAVRRNQSFDHIKPTDLASAIYKRVADLAAPTMPADGIFAVYGNHDHWIAPFQCRAEFSQRGIQTLINASHTIVRGGAKLNLIGVDDYWTGIPKLPELGPKENEIRVILSHNPDFLAETLDHGNFVFDLGLCGHTHGGQIKLPGLGAIFYNVSDTRFAEGLVHHPRGTVYTTRGVGVVEFAYRLNCPAEATVLTLVRA